MFKVQPKTHILLVDAVPERQRRRRSRTCSSTSSCPALTLGLLLCGVFIRLVRVNMLQTMQADYVEAAQARGISRAQRDVRGTPSATRWSR